MSLVVEMRPVPEEGIFVRHRFHRRMDVHVFHMQFLRRFFGGRVESFYEFGRTVPGVRTTGLGDGFRGRLEFFGIQTGAGDDDDPLDPLLAQDRHEVAVGFFLPFRLDERFGVVAPAVGTGIIMAQKDECDVVLPPEEVVEPPREAILRGIDLAAPKKCSCNCRKCRK